MRRRKKQLKYNKENNITPQTILKTTEEIMQSTSIADSLSGAVQAAEPEISYGGNMEPEELIERITKEMKTAAANLEFERAAALRDEIKKIKKLSSKEL